jgi:acyl transferase domain-containing protein
VSDFLLARLHLFPLDDVDAVLGEGRSPGDRVWLTSVKTNIGHAESASGVASLIKVILSLQHEAIPPLLHFQKLNPHLSPDQLPFTIPTRLQPWPRSERPRLAAVNSFGMSGVNAHVVLEEAPAGARPRAERTRSRHLFCLSAQTDAGLRELAQRYRAHLDRKEAGEADPALGDLAFTANAGRSHLQVRLAVTAGSRAELDGRLESYLQGGLAATTATSLERTRVAFLFPDDGDQYPGMGRRLYEAEPVFRAALDRCEEAMRGRLPNPLLDALLGRGVTGDRWPEDASGPVALYAFQCALCDLWRSWGAAPHAAMGSGLGELAAAYAAGMLSLEDGARLAAASSEPEPGTLAPARLKLVSASVGGEAAPEDAPAEKKG